MTAQVVASPSFTIQSALNLALPYLMTASPTTITKSTTMNATTRHDNHLGSGSLSRFY